MASITGNWSAPNKGIRSWVNDWLYRSSTWSSPRKRLAEELRYIRKAHGVHEASEYRCYLLWIGVYPVRLRRA